MPFASDENSTPDLDQPGDCLPSPTSDDLNLVRQCDVKGVLHTHTQGDDGAHSLSAMVQTAREIGLEYLGVSDHLRTVDESQGLDTDGVARQRDEIEDLRDRYPDFDILQGVEVDADREGNLPVGPDLLNRFDYVIVSLANGHDLDQEGETRRAVAVVTNSLTSIMSKPVGGYMLCRPPLPIDMEAVLQAAAHSNTAVEIDANPHSLELDWTSCLRAQELGIYLSINPNAHRAARLVDYRHGVELVRGAGICCRNILNTLSAAELRAHFSSK